jgi:hypothetical protein
MVNSEELIGTTEYMTLQTRYSINRRRRNQVRLYIARLSGGRMILHSIFTILTDFSEAATRVITVQSQPLGNTMF